MSRLRCTSNHSLSSYFYSPGNRSVISIKHSKHKKPLWFRNGVYIVCIISEQGQINISFIKSPIWLVFSRPTMTTTLQLGICKDFTSKLWKGWLFVEPLWQNAKKYVNLCLFLQINTHTPHTPHRSTSAYLPWAVCFNNFARNSRKGHVLASFWKASSSVEEAWSYWSVLFCKFSVLQDTSLMTSAELSCVLMALSWR